MKYTIVFGDGTMFKFDVEQFKCPELIEAIENWLKENK